MCYGYKEAAGDLDRPVRALIVRTEYDRRYERSKQMGNADNKSRSMALYETIMKLKDVDECCRFFDDLCTPTELRSMEQRFDVAVYLQQGLVYLDILDKTGASSATISRVRRAMLDNGAGGVMQQVIIREGYDKKKEDGEG